MLIAAVQQAAKIYRLNDLERIGVQPVYFCGLRLVFKTYRFHVDKQNLVC